VTIVDDIGAATLPPGIAAPDVAARPLREARDTARRRRSHRVPRPIRRLTGPLLLVVLWQFVSATGVVDAHTLAPPSAVLSAGWELLRNGELQQHLWVSLRRVMIGLSVGVTTGVAIAIVAGLFRRGEDLLDPVMQILRSVPVLGLLPLVIIWFGIGEEPKIALVAVGTAFPVYLNTYAGIRSVDAKLIEAATTFGVSRRGLVRYVILPAAVPGFLVGLRFSVTGAWLLMVVAEQINAKSGLGYLMNEARTWFRTDIIVLCLAIYGVLGLLTDGIVRLLERRLLRWQTGFTGT
jgi:sulfonate transport system permease protein